MGSIKHIIAGMALAAALVGFAISFALRPAPAPQLIPTPAATQAEIPEADERRPATVPEQPPVTEPSPPLQAIQKPKPAPIPVETRIGGRGDELELAAAGTLDGAALASVTTGQSAEESRNAGLVHRMGASERITETPAHEFTASAKPPLTPQNLDKLLPLFGVQPTR